MRTSFQIVSAVALSLIAAAALGGGLVAAGEKAPRERVEELMPRLLSEEDAVRSAAERDLFALGEPGRLEMERLSRDRDPRRAIAALRLLQSDSWAEPERGERPLTRQGADGANGDVERRLGDLESDLRARVEAMRRQMEKAFADVRSRGDARRFRLPDVPKIDWPDVAWPGIDSWDGKSGGTVSGSVTRDDRTITWSRDAADHVRVTVRDGDAEETVIEADSEEAFRKANPDVARELDSLVLGWSRGGAGPAWRLRLPESWGLEPWRLEPSRLEPSRLGGPHWRGAEDDDSESGATPLPAPSQPQLGITFDPPSELLRHHLRLERAGMVVTSVLPKTTAARLGIEPLDVLVTVAGKPVKDGPDVRAALVETTPDDLRVEVIRRGERMTLPAR